MAYAKQLDGGTDTLVGWRIRAFSYALITRSLFKQRVQTYSRDTRPSLRIRTRWRFASKRRFVATIEWLRL
jgi:hypothetical protein